MNGQEKEAKRWNMWFHMRSLAILFLCLVGSLSAFGQWTTPLGIFTNQSNFTFSNNGTALGVNTQMVYLPDGANHSSLRFAYVNGSNFNQLLHCSKSAVTGSGWVAVQIPQIQTGTNTTTIVAVWNTSESFIANVSTCGAGSPFTTSIPTPAAANFDSTILEQDNPTYLRLYMAAGGGSARSYPSAANMLSIISFEMLNVNATVGRPCVGWGNPSAGVFACMVFGQINASFYGDWTGYASGNISSPVVGMPVTLLLDMNTTQAMGRLLYPNGTATPWLSVGGAVPTSNGSVASFGMDFDQQVKVHFVGASYGYGLRNITYMNTTGTGIPATITTILLGPTDLTSYNSATTNVTLAINCSGNDASGYLVNITKNGDANITGVSAPNNITLNYSLGSLSVGTYVWSALCYNATTSTNSTTRTFYIANNLPNISALNITQNGSAFTTGPLQANITAQDAENTSLTIFYTWFKNGANTSSGSYAATNNTMTTLNAGLGPYNTGDKWNILVQASDGSNISAGNVSQNTTITAIGFFVCNASINTTSIIYKFYDALTLASLNASISNTITWTGDDGTTQASILTGANNTFYICITPSWLNESATTYETVYSAGYLYFINSRPADTYSSSTITRNIYLNQNASSAYYRFITSNEYGAVISGAQITITRGTPPVALVNTTTDVTGSVYASLQQLVTYDVSVSATGYQNQSFSFTSGSETTIPITLQSIGTAIILPNFSQVFTYDQYSLTPTSTYIANNTTIVYTVISANSTLSGFGITIVYTNTSNNGTQTLLLSGSSTNASGGAFALYVDQQGIYTVNIWFKDINYENYTPVSTIYILGTSTRGLVAAKNTFAGNNVISGWGYYFVLLVLAMLVGGFVSRISLEGAVFCAWILLFVGSYINPDAVVIELFTPPPTTIGAAATGITTMGLTVLLGILGAAVFYLKQYGN